VGLVSVTPFGALPVGVVPVSVIIPARNAAGTLGACLDALAAQGVPGPAAELIVVDDASIDETHAVASRPGVRVLTGQGQGPAAARNLGARAATGDILIFLDADTVPLPDWLAKMVAPLEDPQIVGVKGRYYTCQTSLVARFAQLEFESRYDRLQRAASIDFVDTGTAAFRRATFLATGGFDEGYTTPSSEDVDLSFRMASAGARFAFNPHAAVFHRHAESLVGYLRKKAHHGYTRTRVYRRHPAKVLGDSYTPPAVGAQVGLAGLTGILALLAAARVPRAGVGLAAALLTFLGTTVPLLRRVPPGEPRLLVAAPLIAYARAWAIGLGMLRGVAGWASAGLGSTESKESIGSRGNMAGAGSIGNIGAVGSTAQDPAAARIVPPAHVEAAATLRSEAAEPVSGTVDGTLPWQRPFPSVGETLGVSSDRVPTDD
jgi:GT2 family glycosyltransferase